MRSHIDKRTVDYPPDVKFWLDEDIEDFGYIKYTAEKGYNGNMPAFYCTKDNSADLSGRSNVFKYDNCFHMWDFEGIFDINELDVKKVN